MNALSIAAILLCAYVAYRALPILFRVTRRLTGCVVRLALVLAALGLASTQFECCPAIEVQQECQR